MVAVTETKETLNKSESSSHIHVRICYNTCRSIHSKKCWFPRYMYCTYHTEIMFSAVQWLWVQVQVLLQLRAYSGYIQLWVYKECGHRSTRNTAMGVRNTATAYINKHTNSTATENIAVRGNSRHAMSSYQQVSMPKYLYTKWTYITQATQAQSSHSKERYFIVRSIVVLKCQITFFDI